MIAADQEAEIVALVRPYALGDTVEDGWTLHSLDIEVSTVHLWLGGPGERLGPPFPDPGSSLGPKRTPVPRPRVILGSQNGPVP